MTGQPMHLLRVADVMLAVLSIPKKPPRTKYGQGYLKCLHDVMVGIHGDTTKLEKSCEKLGLIQPESEGN